MNLLSFFIWTFICYLPIYKAEQNNKDTYELWLGMFCIWLIGGIILYNLQN